MNELLIFVELLKLENLDERAAKLTELTAGDAALRARVEELLAAHGRASQFMPTSHHPGVQGPPTSIMPEAEEAGMSIGPYKLLQEIGEGGMGTVFMAEQSKPVQRRVALKIIKSGMDTRQVIARFEAERQALALMDHPNIAKVLDAGATTGGRPYFVMELVKGIPITKYCDERQLSLKDRLELFVQVCQAIQHAHQKGIIHRDIKPSNVLVAQYDGLPVPKVIDFGVAKATAQKLTEKTMFTEFGMVIGTVEYMSPEQAEVNQLDIDTRSDVYSLGVVLYELLTGTTPLDGKKLRAAAQQEMLRMIREEEPSRPSIKLSTSETLPSVAASRGMEPSQLKKMVTGELDWIVMKALEKERSRRYLTPVDLAEEIGRFLRDEPVRACPPSLLYRSQKIWRRHRAAIGIASLLLVTMIAALAVAAGSIGYVYRDQSIRRESDLQLVDAALLELDAFSRAEKWSEAKAAHSQLSQLMESRELPPTTRSVIQQRLREIEWMMRLEQIRLESASVKTDRFDAVRGEKLYLECFREMGVAPVQGGFDWKGLALHVDLNRVRTPLLAAIHDWVRVRRDVSSLTPSANALLQMANELDNDPWRKAFRDACLKSDRAKLEQLINDEPQRVWLTTDAILLKHYLGRDEALKVMRRAQMAKPNDFWCNETLGMMLLEGSAEERAEAASFLRAAVALRPDSAGALLNLTNAIDQHRAGLEEGVQLCKTAIASSPRYSTLYVKLASNLKELGRREEAEKVLREIIAADPTCFSALNNLGVMDYEQKRFREAAEAFEASNKLNPADEMTLANLGNALDKLQRYDDAELAYKAALKINPKHDTALNGLGGLLCDTHGDFKGAIDCFKRAIDANPTKALYHRNLAIALASAKQLSAALKSARRAVEIDEKDPGNLEVLVTVLEARGDFSEAIKVLEKVIAIRPNSAEAHFQLGKIYSAMGESDKSMAALETTITLDPTQVEAICAIGSLLCEKGDFDKAVTYFDRARRVAPDHHWPYYQLSIAYLNHEDWKNAEEAARNIIARNPNFAEGHCNLGSALRAQNRLEEALAAYRKGHELGSKQPTWAFDSARWVKEVEEEIAGESSAWALPFGLDQLRTRRIQLVELVHRDGVQWMQSMIVSLYPSPWSSTALCEAIRSRALHVQNFAAMLGPPEHATGAASSDGIAKLPVKPPALVEIAHAEVLAQGAEVAPADVDVSPSGHRIIAGRFSGKANFGSLENPQVVEARGSKDGFVAQYAADHSLRWVRRMGGDSTIDKPGVQSDAVWASRFDAQGNTFVAGCYADTADFEDRRLTASGKDAFAAKYDPAGNLQWVAPFDANGDDEGDVLAVDPGGNAHVVVQTTLPAPDETTRSRIRRELLRLNADGTTHWRHRLHHESLFDGGIDIDSQGGIFYGGTFVGQKDFDPGAGSAFFGAGKGTAGFLLKLDSAGNFEWVTPQTGKNATYFARSVHMNHQDEVLLAGTCSGEADFDPGLRMATLPPGCGSFVAKFTQKGDFEWLRGFPPGTKPKSAARCRKVSSDEAGNVYVLGDFSGIVDFDPHPDFETTAEASTEAKGSDVFVVKLDSQGHFVWLTVLDATGEVYSSGLQVSPQGAVTLVGRFNGELLIKTPSQQRTLSLNSKELGGFVVVLQPSE